MARYANRFLCNLKIGKKLIDHRAHYPHLNKAQEQA